MKILVAIRMHRCFKSLEKFIQVIWKAGAEIHIIVERAAILGDVDASWGGNPEKHELQTVKSDR